MKRFLKTVVVAAAGAVLSLDVGAALAQGPAGPRHVARAAVAAPAAASVHITKGEPARDPFFDHMKKVQMVEMVMGHCFGKAIEERHPGLGYGHGYDPYFMGPPGDLELLEVHLMAEGEQGPLYQVSLRNNSRFVARHFSVSLVAALGELDYDSPVTTIDIKELGSGDLATVEIQLPPSVLTMGDRRQPLIAFDTLFVAIDSFGEIIETNELNNVASMIRTEIAAVAVEGPAPAEGGAIEAPAAAPAEQGAAPAEELPPQVPAAQGPAAAQNPLSNLDLDSLNVSSEEGSPASGAPAQGGPAAAAAPVQNPAPQGPAVQAPGGQAPIAQGPGADAGADAGGQQAQEGSSLFSS